MAKLSVHNRKQIVALTCQFLEIDESEIFSRRKKKILVKARRFLIGILSENELKDIEIGEIISRDRTTVIYNKKKHRNFKEIEKSYAKEFVHYKKFIGNIFD